MNPRAGGFFARGPTPTPRTATPIAIPRLNGVEHRFIDVAGLRMHVAEAGRGEPVVLLHGFPQHWWEWRKVIPGLAERYRVICPDLRGAGWTDAPPDGYDRDQLLADVVGLLDALSLDGVRLIGHDFGALLGYQVCLRHPQRVARYLALAAPPPYLRFEPSALAVMWRLWFQVVIAAPEVGPRLLANGDQRLARHLLDQTSDPDAWSRDDIEFFLAPLRDPARARAGSAVYRRFIMPELTRIMRGEYRSTRLSTSTLVLLGADDPALRPEFVGGYEPYVDDLEVRTVDGASHFIADERPDVVLDRALVFFHSDPLPRHHS